MKAYLRFRVPLGIANKLSDALEQTFRPDGPFTAHHASTLCVTIANFGDLHPDFIPAMNDAIDQACIQFKPIRPSITVMGKLSIVRALSERLLVTRAVIDDQETWEQFRRSVLDHFEETIGRRSRSKEWTPYVALGRLSEEIAPFELAWNHTWKPESVELVFKTQQGDLIVPRWTLV